jgi:hypothetical protein
MLEGTRTYTQFPILGKERLAGNLRDVPGWKPLSEFNLSETIEVRLRLRIIHLFPN